MHVRKADSNTTRQHKGAIQDWQGFSITLLKNGSPKEFDSSLVVGWQTTWPASYESGNRLAGAGKTNQAIQKYLAALEEEKRPWAQRIIRSKLMTAYQLVGNSPAAIQEFRIIIQQDPNSRFINQMPLPWSSRVPRVAGASDWLKSNEAPIRLLGAGWSLTSQTNQQEKAATALDELAGDLDPRIRDLATAQLWRLRTRLSPLHEQQSSLVAASLYQIASALKSRTPDSTNQKTYPKAEQFLAELQQRFPESIWAQQAMFDPSKN